MASRNRFVQPETRTLHISDGDTITVRKRLNTGQSRRFINSLEVSEDGKPARRNMFAAGMEIVVAYLIDWTLVGSDGKHVDIDGLNADSLREILDDLDLETFSEIRDAISQHMTSEASAQEVEKNGQGGATGSSAISPSRADAAGDTSGLPSLTLASTVS
jgi:uncharacterized protein (DUF2336 family)